MERAPVARNTRSAVLIEGLQIYFVSFGFAVSKDAVISTSSPTIGTMPLMPKSVRFTANVLMNPTRSPNR